MINIAKHLKGNAGDSVKKLQEALNSVGYNVAVDGNLNDATQAAVKDFQSKVNISKDNNGSGALHVGVSGAGTPVKYSSVVSKNPVKQEQNSTTSKKKNNTNGRPEYEKSEAVAEAEKKLSDWENRSPDEYESQYSIQIQDILESILNREEFSYNMNADPLYRQYREQYIENGKKAMMDTVGNATALTGGYANSYAQAVGQQTYDEYLNDLNDMALDLHDRAYEKYTDEGDKLIADITLLRSLDGDDYEKYLGDLQRYYSDGEYLLNKLAQMSDADFEAFVAETEAWENDREYAFMKYQDELDRKEFEKEMIFKQTQADRDHAFRQEEAKRDQANADREYALAVRKANEAAARAAASAKEKEEKEKEESKKSEAVSTPATYKEFYSRTGVAGIMTESEFKSSKAAKEKYGTYKKYLEKMYKKYV